ncbi:lysophospholipid acyltransferase family protein [Sphingomonas kyeonggiensis]|uniref:1-acyl-sn-glycerol-3-phosphate acyltransferase n=1 Tax=Sphingomonas kyeonggiensis TaxID=1268553 RepID=A0A7W6JWJ4_9SPHN|nr:lysophospholipid acyltransferase family protein [Sphingomonas kyeonggiensis]MBB4099856.1 1-acyl-sn-glycerol-3-phosphate acyltransferase [Sphingomonas kyeonggiensis]
MNVLRTLVFSIFFYGLSVVLVLLVPLVALLGGDALRSYAMAWVGLMTWSARWILGIRVKIEGEIPKGPVIFAGKHESLFEALELSRLLGSPATVMKRELAQIPLWGWAARRYGVIIVNRTANAAALRSMMKDARVALAQGRSVLIFPEGTRVKPGEAPALRSGFAGLYRMLDLPVVPIAVRSGHVWPKHGIKRPGVITFRFEPLIPPGLPRAEAEARVHAGINALNG